MHKVEKEVAETNWLVSKEPTEAEYKEIEVIEEIVKNKDPVKENNTFSELANYAGKQRL